MSSLQSRIEQMVGEECPDPEPRRRLGTQRTLAMWKSMVQTIILMLSIARQQIVLDQLVKGDNIPEDPPSSSTSTFKGSKKPKDAPINQGLGKPLGRSKAHAKFNKEPSECNHRSDALRCRANSKAMCGSRWQRPREDPSTTATSNFQVDEQAKKVKNSQGQEFPKFLPAPRGRLNQGYRQVELDIRGKPKTLVQPHQQPPPLTTATSSTPPSTETPSTLLQWTPRLVESLLRRRQRQG